MPAREGSQITVQTAVDTAHRAGLTGLLKITLPAAHPRRPHRARPVGRPWHPARAVPALAFGIVLATVAVGWLLPVLGVSLLVFLASDVTAGALARRRAVGAS